jgi:multidrug resistance efflux pump
MKRKHLLIISAIIFLLAINLANCKKAGNGSGQVPGIVDGDIITLKAAVGGTLDKVDLQEGEAVKKKEILVQVNSDKIANQLIELDIKVKEIDIQSIKIDSKLRFLAKNIAYLSKQVKRYQRLSAKKAVPGEKLEALELKLMEAETTQFELRKTKEELEIQKEKIANKRQYLNLILADHRILSPVNGFVVEAFVSQGEMVFPGTAVADILDRASLYVEIFIEAEEMAALKLNQQLAIQVDGVDTASNSIKGIVSYFGKKAEFSPKYIISETERKSLLYQVKLRVEDPKGILKVGMPVTVALTSND